jgi:hypothetical protein
MVATPRLLIEVTVLSDTLCTSPLQVVEGELAWLVYIVGAVVGARGTSRF